MIRVYTVVEVINGQKLMRVVPRRRGEPRPRNGQLIAKVTKGEWRVLRNELKKELRTHEIDVPRADHGETVFDAALRWAERNFKRLEGHPYDVAFLIAECQRFFPEYPGIEQKKWLFVYSPDSASPLFEVADEAPRWMIAFAKLQSVAMNGGLLLAADFSGKCGTSDCAGKFTPLLVCKPESAS